jgi:hypothetical protein
MKIQTRPVSESEANRASSTQADDMSKTASNDPQPPSIWRIARSRGAWAFPAAMFAVGCVLAVILDFKSLANAGGSRSIVSYLLLIAYACSCGYVVNLLNNFRESLYKKPSI